MKKDNVMPISTKYQLQSDPGFSYPPKFTWVVATHALWVGGGEKSGSSSLLLDRCQIVGLNIFIVGVGVRIANNLRAGSPA